MGPATALGGGGGALATFGPRCAAAGACPLAVVEMCAVSGGALAGGLLGPALGTLGPGVVPVVASVRMSICDG